MIELFLASALLPFILVLAWKTEGKSADTFASVILGLSFLINAAGTYEFFAGDTSKVYHAAYVSAGNLGEVFGATADVASVLMGFFSILIAFLLAVYSAQYFSQKNRAFPMGSGKGRFYGLLGLLTGATMVFIYATNLVQFAVALEIMAIAILYLVNFYGNAKTDALKAFLVLNLGVLLILGAVAVLGGGQELDKMTANNTALLLVMFASFAMSSQLLFYSWLPDSTASPVPASAYVHSASIVPLGSFMLFRSYST
ncbi:hypothetical protein [Thermococcus peptonophilus]|uniref:hypothetical protein n=1 Tax=Thermococcus peptonophilus TaxID=53952 RepID=UPI000AE5F7C1